MKKIIVVQSVPEVLDSVSWNVKYTFPQLKDRLIFQSNFEKTLAELPKYEEIVVIASDYYHDDEHILFERTEKNGDRLAAEIKKINPLAKVYIFSEYEPKLGNVDGFYLKSQWGGNATEKIIDVFLDLGLNL
ncbi:MAG: hypothetical protein ACOYL8_05010 [Patescibacteria group bacterium]